MNLGGAVIPDRLFLFGAYEHQEAGQSQDEGPAGAGYPEPIPGVSLAQFNEISQVLKRRLRHRHRRRWSPTGRSRTTATSAAATGRSPTTIALKARTSGSKESTLRADDLFTGNSPQSRRPEHLLLSGTNSKYYSGRLYSNWTDRFLDRAALFALRDPGPPGSVRRRRGPVRQSDPAHHRRRRQPRPARPTARSWRARATRVRPTTSQTTSTSIARVANYRRRRPSVQVRRRDQPAPSLYNLFVQNATGTLAFRNVGDCETDPSPVKSSGTTRPRHRERRDRQHRRRVRQLLAPPATSTRPRPSSSAHLLGVPAGRVAGHRPANAVERRAARHGSTAPRPELNVNFVDRYGIDNRRLHDARPDRAATLGMTYDMDDFASSPARSSAAASASSRAAIRWCGSATPSRTTASALRREPAPRPRCPAAADRRRRERPVHGLPQCFRQNGINSRCGGPGRHAVDRSRTSRCRPSGAPTSACRRSSTSARAPFASGWRFGLDYIFSRYRDPYTIVDLSQTPANFGGTVGTGTAQQPAAIGSTDSRSMADRSIAPSIRSNVGCDAVLAAINPTPVWTNVTAQCFFKTNASGGFVRASNGNLIPVGRDDELMLTNSRATAAMSRPSSFRRTSITASSRRAVRATSTSAMPSRLRRTVATCSTRRQDRTTT